MILRCTLVLFPCLRRCLAGALIVLASLTSVPAAVVLYASGSASGLNQGAVSGLYTINPLTGAATLVRDFYGVHFYNGGLAYDPATDSLYAIGWRDSDSGISRLFKINRFTGAVTVFPGMSPSINLTFGGLAIHPLTGVMYATGDNGFQSTALFTIDKSTGAATFVGQNGGQCCTAPWGMNMYGLGFRADGTLFANGLTLADSVSRLFTVNLASGLASDVGPHGVPAGIGLTQSGLAFSANGILYSLGSTSGSTQGLYSLNPATGAATLIGDTVIAFGVTGGLVFAPDLPQARPALTIAATSTNTLLLSWPSPSTGFGLQQNVNAANPNGWSACGGTISDNGTTRSVTLSPPTGNLFFRLNQP